ncbi:MAG: hypothetical protein OYI31_00690 [Chloroflexota bacterium]|nr:hypothetical protein [Chloroflexota bacterium]MDE2940789.1 hypothetical protein [Chloroflexota bacterium]MDE3266971.1 hypothetical protein [Chloroflexota bacterium]
MRPWTRLAPRALLLAVPAALAVSPVYAHGFGERYSLPVPLEYYLAGAGAAVALSFALIGLFVGGTPGGGRQWRFNLLSVPRLGVFLQSRLLITPIKVAAVGLLTLVVTAGFLGDQDSGVNIAPTLVWIVWWVGLGFFVALVGNVWPLINPWSITFGWAEGLLSRMRPGRELDLRFEYPRGLGVWPAFGLFLGFAWLENSYPGASEPEIMALAVVTYSLVTWVGMLMFGRHVWLRYGEAFSVVFGVLARFAPSELRTTSDRCMDCEADCGNAGDTCVNCCLCWERSPRAERELNVRPYAAGLAVRERVTADVMAMVLLLLATVTFDGLSSTPLWTEVRDSLFSTTSSMFGANAVVAIDTMGLLLIPALFMVTYLVFSWVMAIASGGEAPAGEMALAFVFSLVPIALAYNIAHFFTLLVINGQLIIPLASDPFGYGWDLLGTAGYVINPGVVTARATWLLSVGVIVAGHIIAVYVAHMIAIGTMKNRRSALRSQYPMMGLMVVYTMASLWIIAQPIVEEV